MAHLDHLAPLPSPGGIRTGVLRLEREHLMRLMTAVSMISR